MMVPEPGALAPGTPVMATRQARSAPNPRCCRPLALGPAGSRLVGVAFPAESKPVGASQPQAK